MFWIMGAVLIGLIVTFMAYAGLFDFDEPAPPEITSPIENSDTLTMGDAQFTGFDKRNQAYALAASEAQQDAENPNVIYLTQVRGEIKVRGSGEVVIVRADRGVYDTETEVLQLASNIKVVTTGGITARLSTATVTLIDGLVVSDEPVTVFSKDGTVWANGLRMWDNAERILFTNRVRMLIDNGDGKADAG